MKNSAYEHLSNAKLMNEPFLDVKLGLIQAGCTPNEINAAIEQLKLDAQPGDSSVINWLARGDEDRAEMVRKVKATYYIQGMSIAYLFFVPLLMKNAILTYGLPLKVIMTIWFSTIVAISVFMVLAQSGYFPLYGRVVSEVMFLIPGVVGLLLSIAVSLLIPLLMAYCLFIGLIRLAQFIQRSKK